MEKRLFLAIILSFFILYWWSIFNTNHERLPPEQKSELITNKIDTEPPSPPISQNKQVKVEKPLESLEKITKIETSKFILEFSNIGGKIIRIFLKEYDFEFPISTSFNPDAVESKLFELENIGPTEITYFYNSEDFQYVKKFNVAQDHYDFNVTTSFTNKMSKIDYITIIDANMSNLSNNSSDIIQHDTALYEYVVKSEADILRKNNAYKFDKKEKRIIADDIYWLAFRDRYFCLIVKPEFKAKGMFINPVESNHLKMQLNTSELQMQGMESQYTIYAGPEKLKTLKEYKSDFQNIKRFYRLSLFDSVAKAIYYVLHWIYNFIPNWGLCIIIISTIIYFSMFPLTLKSMLSMRRMQAMQPKIEALKEKYKNNPQKLYQEQAQMFREEGINPLGGCLPLLLQMPIFIGLYQVLWRDVSFKGAGFLWIKDLAKPDHLFTLPFEIPFLGNEFNILPFIMVFIMFFQQKLSMKSTLSTDPAVVMQQKMMLFIMPVFLGFIFYRFPSGLTLYFTMFYLFSTLTQWKMTKSPLPVK